MLLFQQPHAVSTLVYGICWDEIVRFIRKNYPDVETNNMQYGNHATNEVIRTGSNEAYVLNNIYDMAGNVWEWTMEVFKDEDPVCRGGVYTLNCWLLSTRFQRRNSRE